MRGIVSVAMASAFEDRGLLTAFDSIHGSSAGACGGAYFAAGQARLGTTVYFEDINNRNFINLGRPLLGQPIMKLDFLINHVMQHVKPLNVDKLLDAPGFMSVVATNAETGAERIFHTFHDKQQFFRILKASICLPIIAGRAVEVDGTPLFDGGFVQQLALKSAIDSGATHVIVLMTRRRHELRRPVGERKLDLEKCALRLVYGETIASAFQRRNAAINATLDTIDRRQTPGGVVVDAIVRPADSVTIERLTTSTRLLQQACAEARTTAFEYIDADKTTLSGSTNLSLI